MGEQMNAMSVIMGMLVNDAITPYTSTTGGSSEGNVDGGTDDSTKFKYLKDITTADKVGAGILTAVMLGGLVVGLVFMNLS